jgi:hypothetical protein
MKHDCSKEAPFKMLCDDVKFLKAINIQQSERQIIQDKKIDSILSFKWKISGIIALVSSLVAMVAKWISG